MLETIAEQFSPTTALGALVGGFIAYIGLYSLWIWLTTPSFPAPLELYQGSKKDKHHFMSLHHILREKFASYRERFWKILQVHCEMVVIPLRYVDELRNLPEDKISFREENEDRFHASIVGMNPGHAGQPVNTATYSIRHDLTRSLNSLMQDIWDETVYAFETEVGECKDWTPVNVYRFTTQIVALISGRVFAGSELNRNPEYIKAIINYTIIVFTAASAVGRWPWWMRRFAARWLVPEMRTVHQSQADMERILAPVLEKRRIAIENETAPDNMTTWNLRNSSLEERNDVALQAKLQLITSMAALHTTAMQTSHVLFDLASRPEYVEPLRAEIDAAVDASSTGSTLDKKSMPKLRLLDSFMKESQRLNPLGLLTFQRKIMQDITLHDGTVLRKGTHIGVPSSSHATDPDRYDDPEVFDGYRFAKLREEPGNATKFQFVETGIGKHDMLSFGHGNHACPGRFFANNEIKVIMTYLLQNYDIKLPDGQPRPKNIYTDGGMRPDPMINLMFKRRAAA